ncbi:Cytochrome P450 4d2 [Pseudolycoriella hygida]|uniref:Cytochrome P450 4d2 n=1 Tax=Pseudolycoriella hygida TaxID=35572 RepID=A0A9Q0RYP9_9DIPT|nr:Cytochrome P450 4d2 [Pseudolycoriella hygida]
MFVVIITIFLVLFSFVYDYVRNKRKFDLVDEFPGPRLMPFIGNAYNYAAKSSEDVIKLILESHKTYGQSYRTKIYNEATIWTSDLKIISSILVNNTKAITKSPLYNFLKPWLGEGLLTGTGKKWRAERKVMAPMFHSKYFEYFVHVFNRHGENLVNKLKSYEDGDAVDIISLIYLTALDSICEIGCGEQIDALNNSDSEYVQAVTETINQFSSDAIRRRRAYLLDNKSKDDVGDDDVANKIVFIDLLLQGSADGKPLDDDAILDQVNTLTFNGRNSSPVAIAFVLYALGQHIDVQQTLFKEIKYVFGSDKSDPITIQQLQELPYLDSVIKEAMRLYPPIPAVARYIEEDIRLDDGRYIPAATSLAMTLFVAFRDPSAFPEPNEFNPDRFDLNGGVSSRIDPFAFIPFSSGPRNCIGQRYALLLIKTVVVQILRNYEIVSKGEAPILFPQIVLRSKNGVQIGLKNRVY